MERLAECSSISPRISFSHDLISYDVVPVEHRHVHSGSNSGFEFDIFYHESSSADELFSEGKILPTPIKKKKALSKQQQPVQQPFEEEEEEEHEKQSMKETEEKQIANTKSFWRLKRSSSLGCGGRGYGRRLCPLQQLLSRSYSTGSTKQAPSTLSKESSQHHNYQKQQSHSSSSPLKPFQSPSSNNVSYRKPPLRKSNGASNHPALNVYSGNLFGLGSIIFNAKDRNKRK